MLENKPVEFDNEPRLYLKAKQQVKTGDTSKRSDLLLACWKTELVLISAANR